MQLLLEYHSTKFDERGPQAMIAVFFESCRIYEGNRIYENTPILITIVLPPEAIKDRAIKM
jgi:hypothetical protein